MRVYIYIDKSWTNKEWNESVPKHRMICWLKRAIYIYLWLMGQSIGTWINFQNVCAYIILSAFFPLLSHTSLKLKLETKYAFFYLALHWTCLTFESCLRLVQLITAFTGFLLLVFFFSNSSDFGTAVHDSTVLRTSRDK